MYLDRRAASEFFLHFYETLLSWTNFPFYQHIWELPFTPSSCTLGVTNFKLFVSLGRVKGYLMVVICISFVSVVDDIFIYFSVSTLSQEKQISNIRHFLTFAFKAVTLQLSISLKRQPFVEKVLWWPLKDSVITRLFSFLVSHAQDLFFLKYVLYFSSQFPPFLTLFQAWIISCLNYCKSFHT